MRLKRIMGWLGALLTLLKPLFGLMIADWIFDGRNSLASVGIFCLMVSDIFDGVIFRKSTFAIQQKFGSLRRVIDIIGDRFCICLVFVAMIKTNNLPFFIYAVEVVREVLLISVITYGWTINRPIKEPNLPSRIAIFGVGLTAIAWLNSRQKLSELLICLVASIGLIGLWKYYQAIGNQNGAN